jgi:nickel/cobalt exporter
MRQLTTCFWAFALGCVLALVSAYPSWGETSPQAPQTITWEDLQPPQPNRTDSSTVRDYERLPESQLSEFVELVRRRDELNLQPHLDQSSELKAEVDRLRTSLTQQGIDVDTLLEQVDRAREYQWGQATQTNAELDGKSVKLTGYLLPLEQTAIGQVRRFLLVPFVGACMHVPPPPPNQVIYVEPTSPIDDVGLFAKVWIEGTLRPQPSSHVLFRVDGDQRVDVGYQLELTAIEPVPYEVIRPDSAANSGRSNWLTREPGYSWWQTVQIKISEIFTTTMTDIQERRSWQAFAVGLFVSFGYGVLHTLGPGHGKAVIVSYFVGSGGSLRRGLMMGVRIAVFHVISAIAIVVLTDIVLRQALSNSPASYLVLRLVSYASIAVIGAWMLWQALRSNSARAASMPPPSGAIDPQAKGNADALLYPRLSDRILNPPPSPETPSLNPPAGSRLPLWQHLGACSCLACDQETSSGGWLSLAIGAVPCSGALLILLYGLANNMVWISIVMVLAISLGMAITLAAIGVAAIWGRNIADRRFEGNSARLAKMSRWVQIAGTGIVCAIGVTLFSVTLFSGLSS